MHSSHRAGTAALAAGLAFALIGCEKAGEADQVDFDEAEFPDSEQDEPIVEVTGAGSEPRTALRLSPEEGTTQRSTLSFSGGVGFQSMDMSIGMVARVTKVKPDGSFDVEGSLEDLDVSAPGLDEQASAQVSDMLDSVGINWTFTERGDIEHQEITGGLAGLMDQGLSQLFLSLPEEPVGAGATWVVNDVLTQNGMTVRQQLRYKVKRIEGDVVHLDMGIGQRAKDQTVAGATLEKLESSGSGELVLDTTKPLPQRMKLDMKMDMKMKVGGDSQTQSAEFSFDWKSE